MPVEDVTSWVKVTDLKQTGGTITFSGTVPASNTWTGSYEFVCIVKDIWLDLYTTHTFTMNVIQKPSLDIAGAPDFESLRLPSEYIVSLEPYSSCPWNLPYSKKLYVNGTAWTNALYG